MKKAPHVKFGSQLSEERVRELSDFKLEALRNELANLLEGVEDGAKTARSESDRIAYEFDRELEVLPSYKLVLEEMRRRGLIER
jgi:hypothetical protein